MVSILAYANQNSQHNLVRQKDVSIRTFNQGWSELLQNNTGGHMRAPRSNLQRNLGHEIESPWVELCWEEKVFRLRCNSSVTLHPN